jgi:hypothetical protein
VATVTFPPALAAGAVDVAVCVEELSAMGTVLSAVDIVIMGENAKVLNLKQSNKGGKNGETME